MRGRDSKTYYNSASYATPTWVEIEKIIDESLNQEMGTAEGGSRESLWKDKEIVDGALSVEFGYRYVKHPDADDAVFAALLAASIANTPLDFAFLDDDITTSEAQGWRSPCKVVSIAEERNLGDIVEYKIRVESCLKDDSGTLREPESYAVA